ncbi:hypothetical protein ZWY2020_019306 [Hordeum vulgare]|nr:hypothetical protein ZWY2020_019306 [Hordeum vulgare]
METTAANPHRRLSRGSRETVARSTKGRRKRGRGSHSPRGGGAAASSSSPLPGQASAFLFVTGDPCLTDRLQIGLPILYSARIQPLPSSRRRHSASSHPARNLQSPRRRPRAPPPRSISRVAGSMPEKPDPRPPTSPVWPSPRAPLSLPSASLAASRGIEQQQFGQRRMNVR